GGDRDGNPFVTADITMKVADALRGAIIKCYYLDVRKLRRRLTFEGVENVLLELENKLYDNIFIPAQKTDITKEEIIFTLAQIKETLIYQHNGLFVHLVNGLINRLQVFGLHFASLDIRQDSSAHGKVLEAIASKNGILPREYSEWNEQRKLEHLISIRSAVDVDSFDDPFVKDTLNTIAAVKEIQQYNGPEGCERYIISQCNSALNMIEVLSLFVMGAWQPENIIVDIVPLFETMEALQHAATVMKELYENAVYRKHLKRRKN